MDTDKVMDTRQLLSREQLKLSKDIKEGPIEDDARIVKNEPSKGYLTVSPQEWEIIQLFRNGRTTAELVPELLRRRRCPSLGFLYELILKGYGAGILQSENEKPRIRRALEWNFQITVNGAEIFGLLGFFFCFFVFLFRDLSVPQSIWEMAVSYYLVPLFLSVGEILAACVLRSNDCEVYPPRFYLKTLFPHLSVDAEDAIMGGRGCEIGVALMRTAPIFFMYGFVSFVYPAFSLLLMIGVLYVLMPFAGSPASQLLKARLRKRQLSTHSRYQLRWNRWPWIMLPNAIKQTDKRYLALLAIYTGWWLSMVGFAFYKVAGIQGYHQLGGLVRSFGFRVTMLVTALVVLFFAAELLIYSIIVYRRNHMSLEKRMSGRLKGFPTARVNKRVPQSALVSFLQATHLFSEFGDGRETLQKIAERIQIVHQGPRSFVIHQGEVGDAMYIVYEGAVDVVRELKTGRPEFVERLVRAEIFGEMALLDGVARTRGVRSHGDTFLLRIDKSTFDELVVGKLGRRKVKEIVQRRAFLYRSPFCRNWHPSAVDRLAAIAQLKSFAKDDLAVEEGKANDHLFIVYDGVMEVMAEGERKSRLRTRDFFGEISLLLNIDATASVVATDDSRCLIISKHEFYNMMGEDYELALLVEQTASQRLGSPIFA